MKLADGLHPGLSRDDYDKIEAVNFSTLKYMSKSPRHYLHVVKTPFEDTDAKKLGRAVHIATLEPERFTSAVAVWPKKNGARKGKVWEAFKEDHDGRELLTENELKVCMDMQAAVLADAIAQRYLCHGGGEVTMLATIVHNGMKIRVKGRLDFRGRTANADLKATRDASPSGFGRQVAQLHAHTQASWYSDIYFRITGERKPYKIIAVENTKPHVVQVYGVPDEVMEKGRQEYMGWLDRLTWCRENSLWPAYRDDETDLELPAWVMGDDFDPSGLDLEIGGTTHGQGLDLTE